MYTTLPKRVPMETGWGGTRQYSREIGKMQSEALIGALCHKVGDWLIPSG